MTRDIHTVPRTTYGGIFLISAATLLFQVTFVRIFSVSIWYHFAFLVVSVALFGFGASGVALSLVKKGVRDPLYQCLAPALFAVTATGAYLVANAIPFSPFRIFQHPVQIVYFLLYDLLLMAPFFFAGSTVGLILRAYPPRAGMLYAFDLIGAALGTFLVFAALPLFGAPGAIVLAALLGVTSALLLAPKQRIRMVLIGLGVLHVPLLAAPSLLPDVRMDETKPVTAEISSYGGQLVFSKWNALSRIDVVEKPGADPMIFIDAAAATPVTPPRDHNRAQQDISAVVYRMVEKPSVIVIGSGGGVDVQNALAFGSRSVTAIEINPIINKLVTGRYGSYVGGVFADPRVRLVQDEGRSFINRSGDLADIVQITLIDTWAASVSGAYSLSENYLYTTEAFESYLRHLTPDGYLSITRWFYETPRIAALGRAALARMGITDASRHILVMEDKIRALFLMKRRPFTAEEVGRAREFARTAGATIQHDPVTPAGDTFYDVFLAAEDPRALIESQPMALNPVGDDSPFFFQMTRWRDLNLNAWKKFTGRSLLEPLALPVGQIALVTALGLAVLLSMVLLAIPLLARVVPREGRMRWLGYFLALGIAFIIVEIVLMQRLALFLGHPTYSVTTVLFAILLFSGLGAAWSDRRAGSTTAVIQPVLWSLPVALLLLVFAVPPLMNALIGLPHIARIVVAIAIIAPLAFLMGVPFPVGIRAIGATGDQHIPWAWAANGCASVIGSVCAVLGAMLWNFSVMLLAAGGVYLLALVGITRMRIELD
jgi:spermidine synthase